MGRPDTVRKPKGMRAANRTQTIISTDSTDHSGMGPNPKVIDLPLEN